jgi:hypothetical protein
MDVPFDDGIDIEVHADGPFTFEFGISLDRSASFSTRM